MNYDNNMKGVLFKNDKKRDGKKDADYRGQCEVNGREFWIDSWINKSKDGRTYMSLKFKAKDEQNAAPRREPERESDTGFSDAIPF